MSSTKSPVVMDATEMIKGMKPEDLKNLLKEKIGEEMHQNISPVMQKRVNALKNIQVDLLKTEAAFYDELHELEVKYSSIYAPFYEKRRQLVVGEVEPTETEGKWAFDDSTEEEKKEGLEGKIMPAIENGKETEEKGVKNFWLETFQSFRITTEIIQEYDEEILGYLEDVKVTMFDKRPYGYSLEFFFKENPFFTNKVLTKSYVLKTEVDATDPLSYDGPDLETSTGCTINWKEGKNVCMKLVKKKLKPRNKKQPPKVVTKEERQDSFFNFFETPKVPVKSTDEKRVAKKSESSVEGDHDMDEGEHDAELYLIADFEIAQYLKEKIIPKAILFYTGEGVDDEFDEDDYDEDEDDEEAGDSDEEESDEEDSEEEADEDESKAKGKKGKGGKAVAKAKNGEPTPSECKQN